MEIRQELSEENSQLLHDLAITMVDTMEVTLTRSGALTVDSVKVDHKNVEKKLAEIFTIPGNEKYRPLLFAYNPTSRILDALKRTIKVIQHTRKKEAYSGTDTIKSFDFTDYRPIVSMDQGGEVSFINMRTNKDVKM